MFLILCRITECEVSFFCKYKCLSDHSRVREKIQPIGFPLSRFSAIQSSINHFVKFFGVIFCFRVHSFLVLRKTFRFTEQQPVFCKSLTINILYYDLKSSI